MEAWARDCLSVAQKPGQRGPPRKAGSAEDGATVKYSVTKKGKQELEEMQRTLASAGKKERVMIRLFADLLPAEVWASAFMNRGREIFDVFQEKISQIPQPQRDAMLREARIDVGGEHLVGRLATPTKEEASSRRIVEACQAPTGWLVSSTRWTCPSSVSWYFPASPKNWT